MPFLKDRLSDLQKRKLKSLFGNLPYFGIGSTRDKRNVIFENFFRGEYFVIDREAHNLEDPVFSSRLRSSVYQAHRNMRNDCWIDNGFEPYSALLLIQDLETAPFSSAFRMQNNQYYGPTFKTNRNGMLSRNPGKPDEVRFLDVKGLQIYPFEIQEFWSGKVQGVLNLKTYADEWATERFITKIARELMGLDFLDTQRIWGP